LLPFRRLSLSAIVIYCLPMPVTITLDFAAAADVVIYRCLLCVMQAGMLLF